VDRLAHGQLLKAIDGIDGFHAGVQPIKIGDALTIGGGLRLGEITDPEHPSQKALYVGIDGEFSIAGVGAGGSLIISQYGPLLADTGAPRAVPLGPTGFLLPGVHGGFVFGGPVFDRPSTPLDLLKSPTTFKPVDMSDDAIGNALLNLLHLNETAAEDHKPAV